MSERWLPVVGFEGFYEVSDQGRVRSLDRTVPQGGRSVGLGRTRVVPGRVLRAAVNRQRGGYRQVNLIAHGKQHQRRVGRLVAAAFLGPCPLDQEVRHGFGGSADDRLENLSYGTHVQNCADRITHGTHLQGEKCPQARLSEADVRRIKSGIEPAEMLAAVFGVHPGHINNIRRGTRWAHV